MSKSIYKAIVWDGIEEEATVDVSGDSFAATPALALMHTLMEMPLDKLQSFQFAHFFKGKKICAISGDNPKDDMILIQITPNDWDEIDAATNDGYDLETTPSDTQIALTRLPTGYKCDMYEYRLNEVVINFLPDGRHEIQHAEVSLRLPDGKFAKTPEVFSVKGAY